MSGCTTAFDHQYMFPNGSRIDDQIEAAADVGIRFHAARGSMSLGESDGGLPPDSVVETEAAILDDTARAIEAFHDSDPGAMVRVVVAPCSPFSVTDDLMREAAAQARHYGVHLHTHLAETADEEVFCLEMYDRRPVELMEDFGWAGPDVWYAHAVAVKPDEVDRMAADGTGVAHCPTSNMRLASGIAPVRGYLDAGVRIGLGVDGSASNDGSHLLAEARQAMLLARLAVAPPGADGPLLSARATLEMATIGGAAVLGRDDIGSLDVGKCADLVAVSVDRIGFAGALHDPVAALVFTQPENVDHSWVQGKPVIADGHPVTIDLDAQIAEHNRAARRLVVGG
jgi:cytosine/adenosine deaminase-related metal-dependent hydrolase